MKSELQKYLKFPILAMAQDTGVICLMYSKNKGTCVKEGRGIDSPMKLGETRDNLTNFPNHWEILPVGSQIILTQ